jgi:hypothetical protein
MDTDVISMILERISPRIAHMQPGDEATCRTLFDPCLWEDFSESDCSRIGKCVVRLVAEGRVPLENLGASPRTANHVIYRRT